MEFYKNGICIRKEVTLWMLREFGIKNKLKSISKVVKNISSEDIETINSIYRSYGYKENLVFQDMYPQWFIDSEKEYLSNTCRELIKNIVQANSIYPILKTELSLRRNYQDKAIGNSFDILQEIQYISSIFETDLNTVRTLINMIEREIMLLKGWRQSDNKFKCK